LSYLGRESDLGEPRLHQRREGRGSKKKQREEGEKKEGPFAWMEKKRILFPFFAKGERSRRATGSKKKTLPMRKKTILEKKEKGNQGTV